MATVTPSVFDSMSAFGRATKSVRLAAPEDILSEIPEWTAEQELVPLAKRGDPVKTRLEIREGAPTIDFAIRALTMSERQTADAIVDAVNPPEVFLEEHSDKPGQPPRRVPAGYNDEDPAYLASLRPLQDRQAAYVVLKGVADLAAATPGTADTDKVQSLMDTLPTRMIKFLAAQIWNMTYAQGDPSDFFTKPGGSPASPSSEPSPRPSPPPKKRK